MLDSQRVYHTSPVIVAVHVATPLHSSPTAAKLRSGWRATRRRPSPRQWFGLLRSAEKPALPKKGS
jgi:hypothetical protein